MLMHVALCNIAALGAFEWLRRSCALLDDLFADAPREGCCCQIELARGVQDRIEHRLCNMAAAGTASW